MQPIDQRTNRAAMTALAVFLAASGTAQAQSSLGQIGETEASGRFTIVRIDDVVARLDTATGQLSTCRVVGETITCGEGAAFPSAPSDARIRALEQRVSALETELSRGGSALTGSDETDVAIDRMQKLFRGFADIVKEFDQGDHKTDGTKPAPNRT